MNSRFYNPHRVCHLKAEGAVESFISKHLHEDWDSLKVKLRTHFSDLCTTQDCVRAVCRCKQGKRPMISYIDEFEELIAGMDSGQGYIQNFVDGLSDLRIKNIILVWWNEGSIRTISEAFDLAMEKETSHSNLAGSGDELLLMTSMGVSDVIVQKISNAVCESMKHDHDREYDLNCGLDSIPTNFLKNRQYGSQGNFPSGNNTRFNNDFPSGNNARFNNDFPSGGNTHFNNDLKGYNPHKEPNHGPFGGDRWNGFYNEGQFRSVPWRGRRCYYVARPNGQGFTQHDSPGETPNNEGNKKDHPGDQKFNHKVPSGYDTKIGPHTGSDVVQVTEEYHPPDADYWEEIMPQFNLDDAIAEGDLLVEEVTCNMIEPGLIDDRDQDHEEFCPVAFPDSDGTFLLKGNVQDNDDIQQIYNGTCLNAQGCCHDVVSL